ncbi:FAD-binding domain-containing protein [Dipodascopsis uninucleata]
MSYFIALVLVVLPLYAAVVKASRHGPVCAVVCHAFMNTYPKVFNCSSLTTRECLCTERVPTSTYAISVDHYCSKRDFHNSLSIMKAYCEYENGLKFMYTLDDALAWGLENVEITSTLNYSTDVMIKPFLVPETYYYGNYRSFKSFYGNFDVSDYMAIACTFYFFFIAIGDLVEQTQCEVTTRASSKSPYGKKHADPYKISGFPVGLIPTRFESLVVAGFLILDMIFIFVDYDIFAGSTIFSKTDKQLTRAVGDRTGIVATSMTYHRWIGRSMYLHATLHSTMYTVHALLYGVASLKGYYKESYIISGTVAIVAGGLIIGQAQYALRHYWYETFFVLHILSVILFTLGVWRHCTTIGWMEYIYGAIAVWAFDRLVRLIRPLYYGSFNPSGTFAKATMTNDLIELEIDPPEIPWRILPGQYAYIYFAKFKFWENHPFSLLEIRNGKHIYIARPKKGITKTISNYLEEQPSRSATLRMGVEGPYGHNFSAETFDTVLLLAGGVWISGFTISEFSIGPLRATLRKLLTGENPIGLHIFITKSSPASISIKESKPTSDDDNAHDSQSYSNKNGAYSTSIDSFIEYGRPEISTVIEQTILNAHGSVVVSACGPDSFNDICHAITAVKLDKGPSRVEYIEENGLWS